MSQQSTAVVADPALLSVEFRHEHRLLDRSGDGFQLWTAQIRAEGTTVGTMRIGRCLYWKGGNTFDRMVDEGDFFAQVASQVFDPDGSFTPDYEAGVEMPNNLLVLDHLDLQSPWQDPLITAALVAAAIDRFSDNYFAVLLPTSTVGTVPGAALLHRAGEMLGAEAFGEELLLIDTSLARPGEAARRVRERLRSLSQFGPLDLDGDEEEDEGWELSPRTAALLAMALEDLSRRAWEEAAALGDEPLAAGATGMFASLPRITFRQLGPWRREMARTFDDLAADIAAGVDPLPQCTGEEMALHLAIGRAEELLEDRPRLVADRTGALPVHRSDMDLEGASDCLFQDHDVLMLFDARLDGIEDPQDATNQTLGMVNLAPLDWFTPFDPEGARDPQRGFRTP